jgi:hypothetical protein
MNFLLHFYIVQSCFVLRILCMREKILSFFIATRSIFPLMIQKCDKEQFINIICVTLKPADIAVDKKQS